MRKTEIRTDTVYILHAGREEQGKGRKQRQKKYIVDELMFQHSLHGGKERHNNGEKDRGRHKERERETEGESPVLSTYQ